MIFGGLLKNSLIDFPGKISSVVFTTGCNFFCPYCHNPELINRNSVSPQIQESEIFSFLKKRRGLIDGVVISGGEPTLNSALSTFCKKVKELDFLVKLDTNGTNPDMVEDLINNKIIDYIAMDIKSDLENYAPFISQKNFTEEITATIDLIMNSGLAYEFRTTCARPFIDERKIKEIGEIIKGADLYYLQRCKSEKMLNNNFFQKEKHWFSEAELKTLKSVALSFVSKCIIR